MCGVGISIRGKAPRGAHIRIRAAGAGSGSAARGKPALDGTTRTVIALLVLSLTGLFAAGVLAVYTFVTPGAEGPVFVASMACAESPSSVTRPLLHRSTGSRS